MLGAKCQVLGAKCKLFGASANIRCEFLHIGAARALIKDERTIPKRVN